jgi:hypothetical protein
MNRVDDAPGRLDGVLPREERRVARHRVAEQSLVGVHLVAPGLLHDRELGGLPRPSLRPGFFARAPMAIATFRARAEAHVVAHRGAGSVKTTCGGFLSSTMHLGARHLQALARADEERHAVPAPRVDVRAGAPRTCPCTSLWRPLARRGSRGIGLAPCSRR